MSVGDTTPVRVEVGVGFYDGPLNFTPHYQGILGMGLQRKSKSQ